MARRSRFPQMGGEAEAYHIRTRGGEPKYTPAGHPEIGLSFGSAVDLGSASARATAANTFLHSIMSAPHETVASGSQWYPRAHAQVQQALTRRRGFLGSQGNRSLAAAGLFASVSPNTDWDNVNVHAITDLGRLRQRDWNTILGAERGNVEHRGQVEDVMRTRGVEALARAPVQQLQNAGRIIRGEDPDEVLSYATAPKTHSFMHNIYDPSDAQHVTIDGRAFDTLTNRLRPWEYNRQIGGGGAGLQRYQHAAGVVQGVAQRLGMDPSAAQAVSWEHVKYNLEQGGYTRKGKPRSQGPRRVGQAYFHPHTGEPALHTWSSPQLAGYV